MNSVLSIVVALICVSMAGVFAAAEACMARVTKREAAKWVEQDRRGARVVMDVLDNPAPVFNVAVLLRVLMETFAVVLVGAATYSLFHNTLLSVVVTSLAMGIVMFVLVGVSPRTLGREFPEEVALFTLPALRGITSFLGPFPAALVKVTNALTPGQGYEQGPFVSEMELRDIVDVASESQGIDAEERRMVQAVFELGETLVREVMVPRTDLVTIPSGTPLDRAMRLFIRSGFSRVPVIGESRDDILGMLYFKDVARRVHAGLDTDDATDVVDDVMRECHFVPDSLTVERMMANMQARNSHVSVLVDEYGGVAGLVTMEDLVEEIVGEIDDEHDVIQEDVEDLGDGLYRVNSRLSLNDLGDVLDTDIEEDAVDTVGGLLAVAIGKVPIPGAKGEIHGLAIQAERFEGRRKRLATVLVRRVPMRHDDDESGRKHLD